MKLFRLVFAFLLAKNTLSMPRTTEETTTRLTTEETTTRPTVTDETFFETTEVSLVFFY